MKLMSFILVPGILVGIAASLSESQVGAIWPLWDVPVGVAVCAATCADCQTGGHATVEGSEEHPLHEKPQKCYPDTCDEHECGGLTLDGSGERPVDATTARKLIDAVLTGAAGEVAAMIREYPSQVVPVPEREAIQLLGCQGQVIMHIPVAGAM